MERKTPRLIPYSDKAFTFADDNKGLARSAQPVAPPFCALMMIAPALCVIMLARGVIAPALCVIIPVLMGFMRAKSATISQIKEIFRAQMLTHRRARNNAPKGVQQRAEGSAATHRRAR